MYIAVHRGAQHADRHGPPEQRKVAEDPQLHRLSASCNVCHQRSVQASSLPARQAVTRDGAGRNWCALVTGSLWPPGRGAPVAGRVPFSPKLPSAVPTVFPAGANLMPIPRSRFRQSTLHGWLYHAMRSTVAGLPSPGEYLLFQHRVACVVHDAAAAGIRSHGEAPHPQLRTTAVSTPGNSRWSTAVMIHVSQYVTVATLW